MKRTNKSKVLQKQKCECPPADMTYIGRTAYDSKQMIFHCRQCGVIRTIHESEVEDGKMS